MLNLYRQLLAVSRLQSRLQMIMKLLLEREKAAKGRAKEAARRVAKPKLMLISGRMVIRESATYTHSLVIIKM